MLESGGMGLRTESSSEESRTIYFPEIEGLGTTYEAYVTSRILDRFVSENGIRSVCEYPVCTFRVPGAIAMPLAIKGCRVTLATTNESALQRAEQLCKRYDVEDRVQFAKLDVDQLESESFDLVFHLSLLPTMERDLGINPYTCLREMVRLSNKYLIVTNHNLHYSIPVDRILSYATRTQPQFGDVNLVGASPVKTMLRNLGATVMKEFFFDIPPWMAIDLSKIFSGIRVYSTQNIARSDERRIDRAMLKYTFIERSSLPSAIKRVLAHHVAIIAEKPSRPP